MLKVNKLYLVLSVLVGIMALSIGGPYPYLVFYIFLLTIFLALFHIIITRHCFDVDIDFKRDYYSTGDQGECITKINLNLAFPIPYLKIDGEAMRYSDSSYSGEMINLTADENKWIRCNIVFRKRGVYHLGRVEAHVTDIFNIVTYVRKIDKNVDIKVYPRLYSIKDIDKGGRDIFLEKVDINSTNEEQSVIKDVRKYRVGDNLKKIHWKISAKFNELYVKNTETISGEQYVVLVDMNKKNYDFSGGLVEEQLIGMAVSIIDNLSRKELDVDVYLNKKVISLNRITCRQDFENFIDFMVLQISDGEQKMTEFMHQLIHNFHRSHKILLVIPVLDDNITDNILSLKDSGYDLAVSFCMEDAKAFDNKARLERMMIGCMSLREMITDAEI
ncbi:MAG: DUF58 domain-containing protein [Bacillota bacterium]|nr:DUF58 domain-containing protein [Bacillota bacterium]